jgi:hypothetical protein
LIQTRAHHRLLIGLVLSGSRRTGGLPGARQAKPARKLTDQ